LVCFRLADRLVGLLERNLMSVTAPTPAGVAGRPPTPPTMGFWHRRIHPRILDRIMHTSETERIRSRVCAGLVGEIVEIGFGTGLNLPHLPPAVRRVLAVEPLDRAWELAAERVTASPASIEYLAPDARHLPLPDHSVDAV